MRCQIAMILTVAALAFTGSAMAATSPAPIPKPAASAPGSEPAATPENPKHAACEKTWKAQTKHTGKHKAFIAACVAKG